jgi:hypothetical protein
LSESITCCPRQVLPGKLSEASLLPGAPAPPNDIIRRSFLGSQEHSHTSAATHSGAASK